MSVITEIEALILRSPLVRNVLSLGPVVLLVFVLVGFAGAEESQPAAGAQPGAEAASDVQPGRIGFENLTQFDQTIVTASRGNQRAFDAPFSINTVTAEDIFKRQYRTTPEALGDIPAVMVQKTAFGHGSPYIRGFTSFRNLFLIDGIRLNGPHFRPGPNQYWNTVDQGSIARLEVVKGPASVVWGSDAIGGTVNAITKRPDTYGTADGWRATTFLRFSSAEESFIGRQEFAATVDDKLGFIGGFGGKTFGEVQTGGDQQEGTGYDEWNGDFKIEYLLNDNVRLVGAHYQVRQNNVPRTHKTADREDFHSITQGSLPGDEISRELDQERRLTYFQAVGEDLGGAIDAFRGSVSWQEQTENRFRVRPPSGGGPGPNRMDEQGFYVGTLGLFAHLESPTPIGRFTYGAEYYRSNVNSFKTDFDPTTVEDTIQGPLGDEATTEQLGLFIQDEIELTDRLTLTLGGRFNYASVDADRVNDPNVDGDAPGNTAADSTIAVDDSWSSFVGSARFVYALVPERVNLFGGVSQGFRAPNLGDLTRFDTARSNEFEIPAPGLDEEQYITYEIGTKVRSDNARAQLTYFFTDIEDQILRFPTGGTTPGGDTIVTKSNVGDGQVYGVELSGAWDFAPSWTLFGNASYIEGEVTNFVGPGGGPFTLQDDYLSRLMPLTGQVGVRWQSPNAPFWVEGLIRAADDADKLSSRDAGDGQRIPAGGTPGYVVASVRGGWDVNDQLSMVLGVENLTDENYRIHGSGQNEPGLNVILGVEMEF